MNDSLKKPNIMPSSVRDLKDLGEVELHKLLLCAISLSLSRCLPNLPDGAYFKPDQAKLIMATIDQLPDNTEVQIYFL